MKTMLAKTKSGKELEVEVKFGVNGIYGVINNIHNVTFETITGRSCIALTPEIIKAVMNVETSIKRPVIALTEDWEPIEAAWKVEQKELAMAGKIVGYTYKRGCDAADTNLFEYDFDDKLISRKAQCERIEADEKMATILASKEISEIAEKVGAEELDADGMSYFGYKFDSNTVTNLLEAMNEKLGVISKKQDAKNEAEKAEYDAKFAEAKETGKPVKLESYTVDCNDSYRDCSCDNIVTMAMPDGTTKTNRIHCY